MRDAKGTFGVNIAGRSVRYWVGRATLDLLGWDVEGAAPTQDKYVIIAAPHTTSWDLPVTLGVAWVLGIDANWAGKHSLFEGPFGWFFKSIGGVSIDRRAKLDQVQQLVNMFHEREKMVLVIAPEGTREATGYWKSGFYWIARGAGVPIALGYLDYKRKRSGVGDAFVPGDDLEADVERIRAFYSTVSGKYPERFTNIRFRPDGERGNRDRASEYDTRKQRHEAKRGALWGLLPAWGRK